MTFIAALDQSGGSTPRTLNSYGITTDYNEDSMMDIIHEMRLRIVNSPSFTNEYIDTAIIFEDSMRRGLAEVLVNKGIKPFLKVDKGMNEDGTMKDFDLDILQEAKEYGIVGTKMRSVVHRPQSVGKILDQQYEYALDILYAGFTPIVEPEVDVKNPSKGIIEIQIEHLLSYINMKGMTLKVTIPSIPHRYHKLSCDRVVGLSGGYSLEKCVERMEKCYHMDASFSRALTEGLRYDMSDSEFDDHLGKNIKTIFHKKIGVE